MIKRLNKQQLVDLLQELNQNHQLYLPVEKKDGLFQFEEAVDIDLAKIDLDINRTMLPPTNFLLPLREKIFSFQRGLFKENLKIDPKAILGVGKDDMAAINRLNRIFKKDDFYNNHRTNSLIITIDNNHQTDFDRIMIDRKIENFDLMITRANRDFLLISDSKKGDQVISEIDIGIESNSSHSPRKITKNNPAILSLEKITWAIEKTKPDPNDKSRGKVWQKWADICLGCGNCSYVCPMCFCYDIKDQADLSGNICRVRERTSCFQYSFDKMAGHHPKEDFVDRFYHWYYHKFVAMPKQYGFSGCVNCGRCIKYCPVEINFRTVISEAVKEAENE
jgi:sulfhydrogenase subunit beta (sulfur reductase)